MKKWNDETFRTKTAGLLLLIGLILRYGLKNERWASVFFILSWILAGLEVMIEAIEDLFHGHAMEEEFLMTLASIGAILIRQSQEAAIVMVLYQTGEILEDRAIDKTKDSIASLLDIQAPLAHLREKGKRIDVEPEKLKIGDQIEIRSGERVPIDGTIIQGISTMDTSALTGESLPREVKEGDVILSGFINGGGKLTLLVEKTVENSSAARLIRLYKEASEKKARTEAFVSRFAKIYTPIVVGSAAILAFVLPLFVQGKITADWIQRGLNFLIVSCPCALVISVPVAFVSGMGTGSKRGLLFKGGAAMDALTNVSTLAMDKTGTLTKGVLSLHPFHPAPGLDPESIFRYIVAAEEGSTHPIALAVREFARNEMPETLTHPLHFDRTQDHPGRGMEAWTKDQHLILGNSAFLEEWGIQDPFREDGCEEKPATIVHVAQIEPEKKYLAHFLLQDQEKAGVPEMIQALREEGVRRLVMLTGDHAPIAKEMADKMGIQEYQADLLPEDKLLWVQKESEKSPCAFAGDGLNDAPVIAAADVGFAMGIHGSDAAIAAADIVLMNDQLSLIPEAFYLAKRTVTTAKQNIALALGVKLVILILSALGRAPIWLAVFGDVGVTLICILHSLRLYKEKPQYVK